MKSLQYTLFAAIVLFIFAACGGTEPSNDNDEDPIDDTPVTSVESLIQGNWESVLVTRSEKPMDTDTAQFFIKIQDDTFTSNIFDENQDTPYENGVKASIENGEIYFDELDQLFYIKDIDDNTLTLEIDIKGYPFVFTFQKN